MPIILRLDRVMADRKMSLNELSEKVGVANVNLSKLKNGRVSAIRFSTLEAICDVLDCQPGDILEFEREENKPVLSAIDTANGAMEIRPVFIAFLQEYCILKKNNQEVLWKTLLFTAPLTLSSARMRNEMSASTLSVSAAPRC